MNSCGALLHAFNAAVLLALSLGGCVVGDKAIDSATGIDTTGAPSTTTSEDGTVGVSTSSASASASATSLDDTGLPTTGGPQPGTTELSTTTAVGTSTGAEATTGVGTTTDAGTTTEVGTSTGSTTGEMATIEGSCEAACMVFLECLPDAYPDLPSCTAECLAGANGGPGCEAAATVFNTCIGGFDCAQLTNALENNVFGECTESFMTYTRSCNP